MSMQDITGHYAIPLAHPFSDVPPPYGRRRRPFVASRRPKPTLFDLYGPPRAAASAQEQAAAPARVLTGRKTPKPIRAQDFGSDNRAWVRPHPLRRRWRLTLMTCALVGAACIFVTHRFDERRHGAEHGAVYAAAISAAPVPAVAATEVAQAAGRPAEGAIVQRDRATTKDERHAAASAQSAALRAAGGETAPSTPAAVAVTVASDALIAEAGAPPRAAHARPTRRTAALAARAAGNKQAVAARGTTTGEPAAAAFVASHAAMAARAAAAPAPQAIRSAAARQAAEPAPSAAAAVGMTAAEFTHWLAATRDAARPPVAPAQAAAGTAGLTVELPSHTRLTGR